MMGFLTAALAEVLAGGWRRGFGWQVLAASLAEGDDLQTQGFCVLDRNIWSDCCRKAFFRKTSSRVVNDTLRQNLSGFKLPEQCSLKMGPKLVVPPRSELGHEKLGGTFCKVQQRTLDSDR